MKISPSSSLLGPKSLSLCSSLKVRDQVLHSYNTTGKITVFYNLIFTVLGRRREGHYDLGTVTVLLTMY
jgi:hypothetical protein